ncbi:MAG: hypothetical protein AAFX81_15580 [Pseudomonadota bacterium]
MGVRSVVLIAVLATAISACASLEPGEPRPDISTASQRPFDAPQADVLLAGGRLLNADEVSALLATLGEPAFVRAAGGGLDSRLQVRGDGSFCLNMRDLRSCRLVVADGADYRLFDHTGAPRGTLTPSRG